ncbi:MULTISPECIES: hypothetical protein [Vibrio]|uniref:hypothetical protein n=1 Tax=Vibrio TaxID=662 RepID=UPI0005F0CA57|nr:MULTISPECIES: hypothetical protein [Vibrio]
MEIILIFLALLVACLTLFIQRQHNRKELLPIIHTYFSAASKDHQVTREFKLINDGNGAAILKRVQLHLASGEEIEITNFNDFSKVIQQKNPRSKDVATSLPFALSANTSEVIYSYSLSESADDQLDSCTVTVTAESVYGDTVVAHATGFDVTSNKRDAFFEIWFSKIADTSILLWEKATNKAFKADSQR